MVLNETLAAHKAFLTSAMFARKVDPTIYSDVLGVWDTWIAQKVRTPRRTRTTRSMFNARSAAGRTRTDAFSARSATRSAARRPSHIGPPAVARLVHGPSRPQRPQRARVYACLRMRALRAARACAARACLRGNDGYLVHGTDGLLVRDTDGYLVVRRMLVCTDDLAGRGLSSAADRAEPDARRPAAPRQRPTSDPVNQTLARTHLLPSPTRFPSPGRS
jgi:hypothetical protein